MTGALMRVQNLNHAFGAVDIADKISFDITQGEVLGIIGPNAAGQTILSGVLGGIYSLIPAQSPLAGVT